MNIRNLFQILGFKSKPRHYGYRIKNQNGDEGSYNCNFAQWLHPGERDKVVLASHVEAYKEIIEEGDFCIDIGAHCGDSTVPIAIAAGISGLVLALEPNPYVFHVLQKNSRANSKIANIEPILAAAISKEGFLKFEYSDSGFCNGGRHEDMSVFQHGHPFTLEVFGVELEKELLDDYRSFLPRLKFIKVDAEGYDLYVLKSIERIISQYRPVIKSEVFKRTSREYRINLLRFIEGAG